MRKSPAPALWDIEQLERVVCPEVDLQSLRIGAALLHELDATSDSRDATAELVLRLVAEPQRLTVLVDGFGRVVWHGFGKAPSQVTSAAVRRGEGSSPTIPFDVRFASRRFKTAARLGRLFLNCQGIFERRPIVLRWVRLAMQLARLEESSDGFAVWLSIDDRKLPRPLTQGLPELPWDWNCGEDVRVFHSYRDSRLCLDRHPALNAIPGARSLQLFSLDDVVVS